MKRIVTFNLGFLLALLTISSFAALPCKAVEYILAQQINDVVNAINWSSSNPDEAGCLAHYELIFNNTTTYDSAMQKVSSPFAILQIKRYSEIDNVNSQTIEDKTKQALADQIMLSHWPSTYQGNYLVYHRFLINAYRYAEEMNYEKTKWNKTAAYEEFSRVYDSYGKPFLWFNPVTGSATDWGNRYYDETAETLSIFLKLYELGVDSALGGAEQVWQHLNTQHWTGTYYPYSGSSGQVECEICFHTIIGELYAAERYNLMCFPANCISDINYKLLTNGWNSRLWSPGAYVIRHAESNPEKRLENTLCAWDVMQTYHSLFDNNMKNSFSNLLTGTPKAWQGLLQSGLYNDVTKRFGWREGQASGFGICWRRYDIVLEWDNA